MRKNVFLSVLLFIFLAPLAFAQQSVPYTFKNVEIGGTGFIPGLIYNASEEGLVYARTDMGGVYRRDKATERWIPLLDWIGWDDWNLTGGEAVATDPVDPNRLYIAAGTYTNSWTSQNGAILRSLDRGDTFEVIMMPFKMGGNMPGRSMGERLMIDPNDNRVLYFGARSGHGLWRSTDYGSTWAQVVSFPAVGDYIQDPSYEYTADIVGVVWIAFNANSSSPGTPSREIYVGVANTQDSVYRSMDGGATWAAVPGQPQDGFLPHHGILASNGMLYISYSNTCGPYDGSKGDVWKFDTINRIWTNISPVPSSSEDDYYGYGGLAVDAQNPDVLLTTTLNSWWPDANIYRSTNGGITWSPIWEWAGYPARLFRYTHDISATPWLDWGGNIAPPEVLPRLGWMIGDIEIDPFNSDKMLYGTGATIYGSDNLTNWDNNTPITITVKVLGLEESAIQTLISPPEGAQLLSGMYDVNGFRHDDLTVAPVKMFQSPSIATVSMDYAENMPNFIARSGAGNAAEGVMSTGFSYDGGGNWFSGGSDPGGVTGGGTIAAAADGSAVLWSPDGAGVHVTTNNGSSWTPSTGVPQGAVVASDRVNGSVFYAVSGGNFYVSTDKGLSFTKTSASGLPIEKVDVKAVAGLTGEIWVAGGNDTLYGLWHSTNGGQSFSRLSAVEEADVIGFGKAAPGSSYPAIYTSAKIGGQRGIFRSDDGGASWLRINDDRHQYGWTGSVITGDPRIYGRVYFGTNGRGIIYGDPSGTPLPTPVPTPTPAFICGDVNNSGKTDIVDALMIAQYYVGLNPAGFSSFAADVNGDGIISIIDALIAAQFYVGLVPSLSCVN